MSIARISWSVIVGLSLAGAASLAIAGYSGYGLTAVAVALAAAVNLLPRP